jgi:Carboxypeptidase regulatory-like domain/TonB-dependent Receptor Plug Domain
MGANTCGVLFGSSSALRKLLLLLSVLCVLVTFRAQLPAQSITSGDVTGIVTDPTGATVPGASVALANTSTNATLKATTNSDGSYRFAFVASGIYKLSVTASGFQSQEHPNVLVSAGQPTAVNVQLTVAGASQTVDVVEASAALQTENADVTTGFSQNMIENLPNPGGDLTNIAQTAPGVVMNTQAGYGNFSADGMPGTSNLFTINGQNYNDPFLSLNNSGASNLLLGSNDISEANVINNAYSAQYGQYAGTQVAYITKTGTNRFHGDAIYNWNGRAVNANQFFSNEFGQSTPFNNFNQWATDANGPIWKNRTFFDVDYEGLRNLLPGASALTLIPSQPFQQATLANLAANGNSAEIPFYQQAFKIYNGAPGAGSAVPVPGGGCNGFTSPLLDPNAACATQFRTTPPNLNHEYLWSARVDHTFSDSDRGYIRVLRDNGFQPTYTSPFGSTFNAQSIQPQMSGQVSEIHTFGPNTVNQLGGSVLFYAAIFGEANQSGALSALPTLLAFPGGEFSAVGADQEYPGFFFPQGRRVFQYQVTDDISHIAGKHTFRAGVSWLHDTLTDEAFQENVHGYVQTSLPDFFNGGGTATSVNQYFPTSAEEGFRFNTLGGYIADDWKVSDRLTVSLNLRFEHYANPTCDANCFSHLATPFNGASNPNALSTPYNQMIVSGQHNAFANTQPVVYEPRLGIAWRPFHGDKTVIRMGAGIFADEIEGQLAEGAALNTPNLAAFTIGGLANTPLAPGVPGSLFGTAAASSAALLSQFKSGGSFNSISAAVPAFSAPSFESFPSTMAQPTYYKWNFEIQQDIGAKMILSANYSGMHGIHIPVPDEGLNAYCPTSVCTSGFAGLPTAPPNAAFGQITQYLYGTSNYNGLTISLQRRLSAGLTFNLNYTWSHALDDVSNGGSGEPFGALVTDASIVSVQNPFNIKGNYGSSDYDVRHYVSASFVLTDMFRHAGFKYGPNPVFGGWTLSSNWFLRSGVPFSVVDNSAIDTLYGYNYNGVIFASPNGYVSQSCPSAVNSPCLNTSQFAPAANGVPTGFGSMGRNSIYGPHFFDVDFALMKDIRIKEHFTFSFGAQAYNAFNHPNFDQPVNDLTNPNFGSSIAAVGPPTSILGSFVGAGSSPRFIEIKGLIRF